MARTEFPFSTPLPLGRVWVLSEVANPKQCAYGTLVSCLNHCLGGRLLCKQRFPLVTCAGYARRASPPPFSRDRIFRTAFSSCMAAPREASIFVSFSFSSRRMGGMGAGSRADPPPRMQKRWQTLSARYSGTGIKLGCPVAEQE